MTTFKLSSNIDEIQLAMQIARAEVDPAIQAEVAPYGAETVQVEKQLAPKAARSLGASAIGGHRGTGKSLAESIYLKPGTLGFQTRTNKRYADIINRGGATGPHAILPKRKTALAFNGIVVKGVHHPGSHYKASRFAERTVAVMTPRIVKGWGDAVQNSIERSLS